MFLSSQQCSYCGSTIEPGERWVREKIFEPTLNAREPRYHRYHADVSDGQEVSCWEKHIVEKEIVRATTRAAFRSYQAAAAQKLSRMYFPKTRWILSFTPGGANLFLPLPSARRIAKSNLLGADVRSAHPRAFSNRAVEANSCRAAQ